MAQRALGTIIQINASVIAGLKSINGVGLSAETLDATALNSVGGYREFLRGFKDGGEVSISGFFEPTDTDGQVAVYEAFENEDEEAIPFNIIYPQGASWDFSGIVTGFSTNADLKDLISFEATIKVSGKPSLNFAASAGLSGLVIAGTGGSLSPAFNKDIRYYTFNGVTAAAVKVTATGVGQTIKLFVDGAYSQNLASGSASGDVAMAVGSKKLTIMANESGKAPKIYEVIVVKIS